MFLEEDTCEPYDVITQYHYTNKTRGLANSKAYIPDPQRKICVTPNANAKIQSQWNIGYVGSPSIGACIGHVHFMLFVSISFELGSEHECSFQWNMGFR